MNIAIIEDSKQDLSALLALLDELFVRYDFAPRIDTYVSSEDFLAAFEPEKYDLCFIDIFLPGMNGMETAEQIYQLDSGCLLIFLTCTDQYMSRGYHVRALRYLLKPVSMSQLNDILPECIEQATANQKRLTIQINRNDYDIPFSKIYYVTSSARTELHLKDAVYPLTSRTSFADTVAPLLTDYRFITCSRGIVVNMAHVKKITKDRFLMENGDFVPISRRQFQTANDSFMNFQFEHLL